MSHQQFNFLIEALGQSAGLEEPLRPESGFLGMEVEGIPLSICHRDSEVLIYSALGNLPNEPEPAARLRAELLAANALFIGTAGATLGVLDEENLVTLALQTRMEGLVGSDFVRIVEDFLETATRWTEHVANFETAQTEAAPSPQPGQNWIPV